MIDGIFTVLVLATILGTAVMAGMFFAFSVFVMQGLDRLPPDQSITSMQSINGAVGTPLFLLAFVGTAVSSLILAVASLVMIGETDAPLVLTGSLLYLAGGFVVTVRYHVPRNNAIDRTDPTGPDAPERWSRYFTEWTRANHVRTVACLAATAALVLAFR